MVPNTVTILSFWMSFQAKWEKGVLVRVGVCVCVCMCKKERKILPFAKTWMKLEGVELSETHQIEKNKCCVISLIGGIFKRKIPRNGVEWVDTRVWVQGWWWWAVWVWNWEKWGYCSLQRK